MRGAHHIIIQNRYLKYEFDIKRNLTIIEGDSATGKTTLVEMIREYNQGGSSSGIQLSCDTACRVLEGDLWRELIGLVHNTIFFIDEGNAFVDTEEFAKAVKESDHYYVIVTRESLEMLPISVTEVYGIRSSGKYGRLEPVYHEMYRIYETVGKEKSFAAPDLLITEDSHAGYEFFEDVASRYHRKCMSADGKSNIYGLISEM